MANALRIAWGARAELLVAVAALSGWALITWAIASLTVWQVWPLSGGLCLLSLTGVRLIATVASHGLYALSRADVPPPRRKVPRA